MPTTIQKAKFNRDTYFAHLYRYRIDSDLADRIAAYKADGYSLNQLISILLADYFRVPPPMRIYVERQIMERWLPAPSGKEDNMEIVNTTRALGPGDCPECGVPFEDTGKYYEIPNGPKLCVDCIENFAHEVN